MHVEAGVDEARKTCQLSILIDDPVVAGVSFLIDDLRPRSAVDMHYGGTIFSHPLGALKGDCHKPRRIPRSRQIFITLISKVRQGDRSKRHELGTVESLIQPVIDRWIGCLIQ